MDIIELSNELKKNNINENICRIFPEEIVEGALCLVKSEDNKWLVFLNERGDYLVYKKFDNEHDACRFFLREALLEPTVYKDFIPSKLLEKRAEIKETIKRYGFKGRYE